MPIPAQEVRLVLSTDAPVSAETLEALRHPSPDVLKQQLARVPSIVDGWFASLPRADAPPAKFSEVVLADRSRSGHIRRGNVELGDGRTIEAESIHFASSPEVWLVRTVETLPGVPRYSIYSWYGMHMPCVHHLSAVGELVDGTKTTYSEPAEDLVSNIRTCEGAVEALGIESKITGSPEFRNGAILEFLAAHDGELEQSVASLIMKLPRKILEADLRGDKRTHIWGIGPFERRDLTFFRGDELQIDSVRTACPGLMQIYDILKLHGFSPVLSAQSLRKESTIPFFQVYLNTDEALPLVQLVE